MPMARLLFLALLALSTPRLNAAWWAENDYATGSNGFKKDSLSVFTTISGPLAAGLGGGYYRDRAGYGDRVYFFHLPLMYSAEKYFISLKPFVYPVANGTHSGAGGGKLFFLYSLNEASDESYLHLGFSGAWARQQALQDFNGAMRKTRFSGSAFEAQVEKSFYGQFFLQASAAGFTRPPGVSNSRLIAPVLDQAELAYLGTFRQVTAIPEWVLGAQLARSMKPEFDSHLYAGYSKIHYRGAGAANSGIAGMKLYLTEKSTLDFAYNIYKDEAAARKNYYRVLLQVFF